MPFLEAREHLTNPESDPSPVRDRQGFASRKHVAWVIVISNVPKINYQLARLLFDKIS